MDYDPDTEVGPEISPGIRLVDERIGVEIRGVYDGVSAWAYPDERGLVNRWREDPVWRGSDRDLKTQAWIDAHGERVLADLYPNRKTETP